MDERFIALARIAHGTRRTKTHNYKTEVRMSRQDMIELARETCVAANIDFHLIVKEISA